MSVTVHIAHYIEKYCARRARSRKVYLTSRRHRKTLSLISLTFLTWAQTKLLQLCDFFTGVSSNTSNDMPA